MHALEKNSLLFMKFAKFTCKCRNWIKELDNKTLARLRKGRTYTLVNNKYKICINTTLQSSIKILKCSCTSKDKKWVPWPLRFVAIWFYYWRDVPFCFSEPWFGLPSFATTDAATLWCYPCTLWSSFSNNKATPHSALFLESWIAQS